MQIYHYHPVTREFICYSNADENPARPGEFLLPAQSTDTAPGEIPAGYAAVFNGAWELVQDFRGLTVYSVETGRPAVIDTLGDIPDTFTEIAPPGANYAFVEGEGWIVDLIATSNAVRARRNQLLQETDWTQLPDAGGNRYAWTEYRQALRDIPEQDGFPESVVYPTKP